MALFFFAAVAGYNVHGLRRDTDNQMRDAGPEIRAFMVALIVAEIAGWLVLIAGFLDAPGVLALLRSLYTRASAPARTSDRCTTRSGRSRRPFRHGEAARQIVAFGGGGFSMESGNPLLDDYVLGLSRRGAAAGLLPALGQRRRRPLHRPLLPRLLRPTAARPATSRCSAASRARRTCAATCSPRT